MRLITMILFCLALGGCVGQDLPIDQGQGVDKIDVTNTVTVTINGGAPASTQPATQTVTVNASPDTRKQGNAGQTQGATGGSPGPVTNSPDIKPSVPINITPGAGGLSLPGK